MKFPALRKKTDDITLPKEVQAYYEAEKRDRRGVAGLLAVGTLVVTILLAAGLFFGGRLAYRHFRHTNKKTPTVAITGTSSTRTDIPSDNSGSQSKSTSSGTSGVATSTSTGTGMSTVNGTTSSTTSTGTSSTAASSSTGTGAPLSGTAANDSSNLPSTGSDGSVAAFISATIVSVVIAELYQRRKLTS